MTPDGLRTIDRFRAARVTPCVAAFVALAAFVSGVPPAHARVLNLHGLLEVTSRWSRYEHRANGVTLTPAVTTGLQQHYRIGSTGDIYHPNLGGYTANVSFIDDTNRISEDESQDLSVKDFYFSMNLLPRMTPVSMYAQRIIQDNESLRLTTYGSSTVNTTYNLTWDFPTQRTIPRFRLNLWQTELELDPAKPDLVTSLQRTRAAALDADGRTGNTRYFARYQLIQMSGGTDPANESTGYTVTASADTQFTPALSGAARVNYSSSVVTLGVVTPGLGTLQQRSAGASVFYRPSLQTSLSGTYDYYQDPFTRHMAVGTMSLRPLQELDVAAGYRLSRFDVPDALTLSHYVYGSANYRPMLGLSTNVFASLSLTDVSGATDVTSMYQNYGAGANYFKTLTLITYRLGYQGSYSQNHLNNGPGTSRDLTNVFTAGLSNTQTRLVALSGDYALSLIRHRAEGAPSTDQTDHRIQVTANSSAPRDLFLSGDFLILTGIASYTLTQYRNFSNHIFLLSTTETYETGRGVAATVGYTYEQQAQLAYRYKTTSFIQVRWLSYIVRNGTLDVTAKQAWEEYAGNQPDVLRSEGGVLFTYYLGMISLSGDYRLTYETRPSDRQLNQTAFFKAARPF